jgi:hypothetical protein
MSDRVLTGASSRLLWGLHQHREAHHKVIANLHHRVTRERQVFGRQRRADRQTYAGISRADVMFDPGRPFRSAAFYRSPTVQACGSPSGDCTHDTTAQGCPALTYHHEHGDRGDRLHTIYRCGALDLARFRSIHIGGVPLVSLDFSNPASRSDLENFRFGSSCFGSDDVFLS